MTEDANNELESSPVEDANAVDSSATENEELQNDVVEEQQSEEEAPFHEHPRWKEIQSERERLAEQNQRLQDQILEIAKTKHDTPDVQSSLEPLYQAQTAEEKQFWQTIETVADKKARAIEQSLRREFEAEKKAIYNETGKIMANQFLKDNPDIGRNSQELKQIIQVAQGKGLDLEDAKKIVMFEKHAEAAASKQRKQVQRKTQEKLAANVEQGSVNKSSPIVNAEDDFESAFNKTMDDSGATF